MSIPKRRLFAPFWDSPPPDSPLGHINPKTIWNNAIPAPLWPLCGTFRFSWRVTLGNAQPAIQPLLDIEYPMVHNSSEFPQTDCGFSGNIRNDNANSTKFIWIPKSLKDWPVHFITICGGMPSKRLHLKEGSFWECARSHPSRRNRGFRLEYYRKLWESHSNFDYFIVFD